jgi:cystathionine gamma-synthase
LTCAVDEERVAPVSFARYGNPTVRAAERKLAALEAGDDAALFGSGMAAITTALFALLKKGDHVVLTGDCYRRTRAFVTDWLGRFGVESTVVSAGDVAPVVAAVTERTRVILTEAPTNPDLLAGAVVGGEALVSLVREARDVLGGVLDAHAGYLLLRGLKTLTLRVARQNQSGLAIAQWLETQPDLERVFRVVRDDAHVHLDASP